MKNSSKLFGALTIGMLLCGSNHVLLAQTAPTIDSQPASQSVEVGATAVFSVTASGSEPLFYNWRFNGVDITNGTAATLEIVGVQPEHAGDYDVVVSNLDGSITSDIATLSVSTNPPSGPETFLDFNEDGNADILWVHSSGRIATWLMDGTNFLSAFLLPQLAPEGFKLSGQADFDKDGNLDWLWYHRNGTALLWLMDGTNQLGTVTLPSRSNSGWRVGGLADFDKDGSVDILWHHGNGTLAVWFMDGTVYRESGLVNDGKRTKGGWKVATVLDVDNDGSSDIVWQHGGGRVLIWYMDGTTQLRTSGYRFAERTSASWKVVSTTDLNGDGRGDLVWQHPSGSVSVTLLTDEGVFSAPLRKGSPAKPGWTVE